MIPNNCQETFQNLTSTRVLALLESLEQCKAAPWRFDQFRDRSKAGCRAALGREGGDFPGCYLFFDQDGEGRYVGISRNVIGRVWTHYRGTTHHQTSLVYKLARREENCQIHLHRKEPVNPVYRTEFSAAQQRTVHQWHVAFVRVDDTLTLYLLEVAAAMHFRTGDLNCFKTH